MTTADHPEHSVLVIGCGNMGAAIASGIIRCMPAVNLVAIDPDIERIRPLLPAHSRFTTFADFDQIEERQFDICTVSVKPQHVRDALIAARKNHSDALVISIAAGIPAGDRAGSPSFCTGNA